MTDINAAIRRNRTAHAPGERRIDPGLEGSAERDRLLAFVELLFFAYRDFTGESDVVLKEYGFGRAHHRVLHFVTRRPGLRVADLLDILKITKQSLARVLKQLVDRGFIVQEAGADDRRERRLHATERGRSLASRLRGLQTARMALALDEADAGAQATTMQFLIALTAPADRGAIVKQLIENGLLSAPVAAGNRGLPRRSKPDPTGGMT